MKIKSHDNYFPITSWPAICVANWPHSKLVNEIIILAAHRVYPNKYTYASHLVVFSGVMILQVVLIRIMRGYFTGNGAILQFPSVNEVSVVIMCKYMTTIPVVNAS